MQIDSDGNEVTGGKKVAVSDCTQKEIEKNVYHQSAVATGVGRSADALTALKEANKDTLTDDFISSLTSNIEKVNAFENAEDTVRNYCHIDEIPAGLETTVLRMAMDIYRNEHMGSADIPQTVSSVQIGDTTTSFKTSAAEFSESLMKNYKPVLNRYRKVVF